MQIQIKKGRDGRSTLTCVRADGTRTWGKLHPFFPVHDLTHCAVESVLGFDNQAFFGLIASGHAIDDFAQRGAAARMPVQALWAENIVGMLDMERGTGQPLAAEELNAVLAGNGAQQRQASFRPVTDAELEKIRELRDALAVRWYAVEPGDTLVVPFPAIAAAV